MQKSPEFEQLKKASASEAEQSTAQRSEQASATATANLEEDLQYEKEARREERFLFFVVIMILIDAYIFIHMPNWSGPIVIGLIELVIMTVYARRCGIDEVAQLLDYIVATPEKIRRIKRAKRGQRRTRQQQQGD